MKKYKTSIEVKGENAKVLFDCPIVTDIKKATDIVADGVDVDDMLLQVVILTTSGTHVQVKRGNFLVQDICGHWEVMTSDEWELHKDDTIDEDGETTDTPSSSTDGTGSESGSSSTDGDGGLLDN